MSTMQRTIVLLLALFGSALLLNVPITVKETARTGTDGFPVTFVLPLPYGSFVDTQKLNVVDETGTSVPAQFNVLNKYWTSTPQYLRHVLVHFQPSVSAWNGTSITGIKKYFVRDGASAATPSSPVTVQDASDATTVVTGPLKFILRKTAFTVINELWFDANGNGNFEDNEKVISHNTNNGGVLVERDGTTTQYDADRSDLTWEVEESGPLRAVIRVDYPTLYNGTAVGQLKRGAAVRLYAYAGKPFVYIDYQLQNSANVPLSWYLYFKEMNVDFSLTNFNGNRVRVGMADQTVYEKSGANPDVRLFQHELLQGDLYDGGSVVKSVTNQSDFVWLSLQDTSANVAVTSTIRHFWERWPNALEANGNKVSLQLFPKGSATWTTVQKPWGINPAGLYYLPDMSHFYKESFLYFHKADVSSDSVTSLIKLFHNPPVAVVPTSWYAQAKATLDFGGAVPIDAPSVPTDIRMYKDKPSFDTHNMVVFGNSDGLYRASSCTTGSWPYSAAYTIASEDPADYFVARNVLLAEINTRPAWVAKFDYFRDFPNNVKLTENPYCGGTWRQFLGNGVPTLTADLIAGTGGTMGARDDEHGWFHHAEEAYYLTGNLWYKDWMKFITQFRQVRLHQKDPYPDMSHRGLGHSLQHAMSSFRVTGDVRVLDQMSVYLRNYVFPTMSPYYGDATTAGYQTGYISRWNSNYWQELSYGASSNATYAQYMAEAFGNLYGMIDWNYQYGDFPYYRNRTQYPNSISTGPGLTLVDPELFVYLITGHEWFVNHTFTYVRHGLNGGQRPDGNFQTWIGQYENRIYYRLYYNNYTRADTQAPIKVTDLVAYRKAGDSRTIFRWTPVPDAVRYHGVYCSRPITEAANPDQSVCNWWAGNAIGIPFGVGPFYQDSQYQYFYVDTNATMPAYIAVFSFDDANNMSPMSNVAQATENVLTLPEASYVSIPIVYTDPGNGGNNNSPSGSSSPNNSNSVASNAVLVNASMMSIAALLAIIACF